MHAKVHKKIQINSVLCIAHTHVTSTQIKKQNIPGLNSS